MKALKVEVTDKDLVFDVGDGEQFALPINLFLQLIRDDGEHVRNESQRLASRFDGLPRIETIASIEVLKERGLSMDAIGARLHFPARLIEEFLQQQIAAIEAIKAQPGYEPMVRRLRADPRLIG